MRLVRVSAPEGHGEKVARVAFEVGITHAKLHQQRALHKYKPESVKDVVEVEAATPDAKAFLDRLMAAPFFDCAEYSIALRQPRAIVSQGSPSQWTWPLVVPTVDIVEDLWQFSHITIGMVGRVFLAALLLGYGLIHDKLLMMIAGLMFLPMLPLLLSVSVGAWTREWKLAWRGCLAFCLAVSLLCAGGFVVGLLNDGPVRYNDHTPMLASVLITLVIGVAAALADVDDVGRREMVGLATAAQVGITPAWLGVSLALGGASGEVVQERLWTFGLNAGGILLTSLLTYALLGVSGKVFRGFSDSRSRNLQTTPAPAM